MSVGDARLLSTSLSNERLYVRVSPRKSKQIVLGTESTARPRLRCGACLAGTGTAWKHCRPACAACVRLAGTAWKHCRPLRCVCASGGHCMEALPSPPALRVCASESIRISVVLARHASAERLAGCEWPRNGQGMAKEWRRPAPALLTSRRLLETSVCLARRENNVFYAPG